MLIEAPCRVPERVGRSELLTERAETAYEPQPRTAPE